MIAKPEWFDKLNKSPWMGTICEVGIGIPFQNAFLSRRGASKTILFSHCPYNKIFQPLSGYRSVSEEMSRRHAFNDMDKILGGTGRNEVLNDKAPSKQLFSLSVTASHKEKGERGSNHGWVTLVTKKNKELKAYQFHFRLTEYVDRILAGDLLSENIVWFLNKILFEGDNLSWGDAIKQRNNMPYIDRLSSSGIVKIDVIYADDITMEEHLLLAARNNPLLYHDGSFKRPVDYFRNYSRLLGGSFNPPTNRHFSLGKDAIFCMDFTNPRKKNISEEDMAHKIRMLNTKGVPILINRNREYIVYINNLVTRRGMKNPIFVIGADTFNAVCNDKYIPTKNFLKPLYREYGTKLEVMKRGDIKIVDNEWSRKMNFSIKDISGEDVSSTRVRNGELSLTTDKIKGYILKNNLYDILEE